MYDASLHSVVFDAVFNMKPSFFHLGIILIFFAITCHKAFTYFVLYPFFRLLFGTLYPAYASYKAVRTKNVKEYVKWMMYWIVFALFTCIETFTDVFLSWFPFYYEIKIILVIWLLSPATKGSSILYRKFVHPTLSSKEQEIDEYITKAKEQSYKQVLDLGTKGVSALMQTAIKGGGGLVNQLKKSYSLSDLSDPSQEDVCDETDGIGDIRLSRRRRSPLRSSTTSAMYFSEVDVRSDRIASIQSAEDISSGYSSGEGLYPGQPLKLLPREGLQRTGSLTRSRTTRVTRSSVPKKGGGSDDSDDNDVFDTSIVFYNDKIREKSEDFLEEDIKHSSSSEAEFFDSVDSLHDSFGEKSIEPNKKEHESIVLIACMENQNSSDANTSILTKRFSISSPDQNTVETNTAITDQNTATNSLNYNLEKEEVSNERYIDGKNQGSATNPEDNRHLLHITKDVSTFSGYIRDLIDRKSDKDDAVEINRRKSSNDIESNVETANAELNNKHFEVAVYSQNLTARTSKPAVQEIHINKLKKSPKLDGRGGRYNKKAAPTPPSKSDQTTPIKATLVLQPGVVKNCLQEGNNDCKEFFVHSPKAKRRSLAKRSHSFFSSSSASSSKSNKSLSKLIKFPKMIGFWNKDECSSEKKPSWQSFVQHGFLKPSLSDSKLQSKSYNNISVSDQVGNVSVHGTNSGSLVSVRSLTESPLAYRRLKIMRRYVDDDID